MFPIFEKIAAFTSGLYFRFFLIAFEIWDTAQAFRVSFNQPLPCRGIYEDAFNDVMKRRI